MRLFIAILFDKDIKDSIYGTIERLQSFALGSFTHKENLHLTVNFIGETKRLEDVKQAMEQAVKKVNARGFWLSIGGFGKFKRNEGDIYWIGVKRNETMWKLQKELVVQLKEEGFFDIDDREYKPHITLGRRIKIRENVAVRDFEEEIRPLQIEVKKLSLMKSERKEGKLVYTELCSVKLDD